MWSVIFREQLFCYNYFVLIISVGKINSIISGRDGEPTANVTVKYKVHLTLARIVFKQGCKYM